MSVVELFTKNDCKLCDDLKERAVPMAAGLGVDLRIINLREDDPRFKQYRNEFPVLVAENGRTVSGNVSDDALWKLFLSLTPPPRIYYVAKFLQALAIVVVFFGFMYGLLGDMWTDLYFFLAGIVIFVVGWMIEKHEARSRQKQFAGGKRK